MKKYNLFYKAGDRIIDKKNVTAEEVYDIMKGLKKEDESELRVVQLKDRDEEEER